MTTTLSGMMTEEEFLSHAATVNDMTEEEVLEHAGVKGMKWGHVKSVARAGTSVNGTAAAPLKTRKELRGLNKESVAKDNKARNSDIDAARGRLASGENNRAYKEAKATYKADKKIIGKREAAKAFTAVKEKNIADYDKSQEAKSGAETVTAVLVAVAGLVLIGASAAMK